MRLVTPTLLTLLAAPPALAQGLDADVGACLRLGRSASPAVARVMERWLPPRPLQVSLAAGFAVGPEGAPQASVALSAGVSTFSPFYAEAQVRGLVGDRVFLSSDLLVGVDLSRRRGTYWRGDEPVRAAPWSEAAPSDPEALERWMLARSERCGVHQGAWRLLTGARLFSPIDGVSAAPSLQVAVMLGVSRTASTFSNGARTGLDIGLFGLFDPVSLRPGVMGRAGASWANLLFGLEAAWVMGATGYAYASLDVGVRLSL
ncbi:MAG: hypothetical protein R3A48_02830 [Polyangiales bacterium]